MPADPGSAELPLEELSLSALPVDLVSNILRLCSNNNFVLRSDGSVGLPLIAEVCKSFRQTLCQQPDICLQLSHLRRAAADSEGRTTWQQALRDPGGSSLLRRLVPTALDIFKCDVTADVLVACAEACEVAHGKPLCGLALRKCHSVTTRQLPGVLLASRHLRCLVLSGLEVTDQALAALAQLTELRALCLTDCAFHIEPLLDALPRLAQLRCLLLGGANVLARSGPGAAADGLFALNPPLQEPGAPASVLPSVPPSVGASSLPGETADAPGAAALPHLALLELTFVPPPVRRAIAVLAPKAHVLDLRVNTRERPLACGLAQLTSLLRTACGEGGRALASSAVAAAVSARSAGMAETPLHSAAIAGEASTAALLLAHGCSPDLKDAKGCTPLLRAVFEGRVEVVRMLLATGNVDLHRCNHGMESPAYLAALRGHADCLELLLASPRGPIDLPRDGGDESRVARADDRATNEVAGADRPASSCRREWKDAHFHDGYTPLHAAVIARSLRCVELLLACGFDPSAQNKYDQTALHIAASLEARPGCAAPLRSAELLLTAGCDVTLKDERGDTAAKVAARKGQLQIAQRIIASSTGVGAPSPCAAAKGADHDDTPHPPALDIGGGNGGTNRGRNRRRRGGRGGRRTPAEGSAGGSPSHPSAAPQP